MKVYIVHGSVGDNYDCTTWINSVHASAEAAMWYIREINTHYAREYPRLTELNELSHARILSEAERRELHTLENKWYWHDPDADYHVEEYEVLS